MHLAYEWAFCVFPCLPQAAQLHLDPSNTRTHAYAHAHTLAHTHTITHIHTRTQTRTHTHTHTHTHMQVVLSSDEPEFGGYANVTKNSDVTFPTGSSNHDGRPHDMMVYAPSRTVVRFWRNVPALGLCVTSCSCLQYLMVYAHCQTGVCLWCNIRNIRNYLHCIMGVPTCTHTCTRIHKRTQTRTHAHIRTHRWCTLPLSTATQRGMPSHGASPG